MLDNLTGGRLDLGLGRGLRPPEFEAFGVDQAQSRETFVESFNLIRRIWADENFVHRGKYWTVVKNGPLSPPLVQRPHPPFLVSAQSEESQRCKPFRRDRAPLSRKGWGPERSQRNPMRG